MMKILYFSLVYAGYLIYILIGFMSLQAFTKSKNKWRMLGLTILALILSLLLVVEIPKALITNHFPELKTMKKGLEWGSNQPSQNIYDTMNWWAMTCTNIASSFFIIVFAIMLVLIWTITTNFLQNQFNVPNIQFKTPKNTWKVLLYCSLGCVALFLLGWLSVIIICYMVVRFAFKIIAIR